MADNLNEALEPEIEDSETISRLKMILREHEVPFFTNEELEFHLQENYGDVYLAAYALLIIKSEDSSMNLPGLTLADSSKYFRRLAAKYRPYNSGVLGG